MARVHSLSLILVLHITLLLTIIFHFQFSCSSRPTTLGYSLKLIPRDSPESPLYPGNLTRIQRIERLISFSKAREQYLRYSTSPASNTNGSSGSEVEPTSIQMSIFQSGFFYVVQTVLGTPSNVQFLLMDTGGGLVWTQCLPCKNCYRQTNTLFDSRASSSYRKLPCSHFLCNGPHALYQCVNNECVYSATYGGGGPTKGIASLETFHFARNEGTFQSFDRVIFGCSNDNTNFDQFVDTPISGVLGLSWSPDSLVTQLGDFIQHRFSYCMVPFHEGDPGTSMLTFGSAIPAPAGNIKTITFVVLPISHYYFYLNLLDISVGPQKLGFPPGTFHLNQDGSGGVFIDSGAIMSFLNNQDLPSGRNPYKEVIGAFQKYYDSLNLVRRKENVPQGFELCYEKPADFNNFATMTYHFDGADYNVDGKYVSSFNNDEGYFCLALVGSNGASILGAWHQQNKRIVYDGRSMAMHFSDEICK